MFFSDTIDGKKIIKSDLLSETEHFFTTRELCIFSKNEDMSSQKRIVENYIGQTLATNQPVHGTHIEKVVSGKNFYEKTDGLIVEKGQAAVMNFGDCVPLILFCGKAGMISHAGWRGTAQNMAKISVRRLTDDYGVKPEDIKVVVGPAICMNCYEVGKDVFEQLYDTVKENREDLFLKKGEKYFVDLKGINRQQLREAGVEKIDVCPYCTACGEKLFFSYRYEKNTGRRHSAVLKL